MNNRTTNINILCVHGRHRKISLGNGDLARAPETKMVKIGNEIHVKAHESGVIGDELMIPVGESGVPAGESVNPVAESGVNGYIANSPSPTTGRRGKRHANAAPCEKRNNSLRVI
ncbi:hypothetical protein KAH81_09895 [bacterium]|nr:hypothetical protein [bacterium]